VVLFSIWGKTYFSTLQLPDRTWGPFILRSVSEFLPRK
jgi:hypothetical protein